MGRFSLICVETGIFQPDIRFLTGVSTSVWHMEAHLGTKTIYIFPFDKVNDEKYSS